MFILHYWLCLISSCISIILTANLFNNHFCCWLRGTFKLSFRIAASMVIGLCSTFLYAYILLCYVNLTQRTLFAIVLMRAYWIMRAGRNTSVLLAGWSVINRCSIPTLLLPWYAFVFLSLFVAACFSCQSYLVSLITFLSQSYLQLYIFPGHYYLKYD